MSRLYLAEYSVQGIKNINKKVTLSFYKKTVNSSLDIKGYNIKGVYGMNGSGKSAIITSVRILKNLLLKKNYLNDQASQNYLKETINKQTEQLNIEAVYLLKIGKLLKFTFSIVLSKNNEGMFEIEDEQLLFRYAYSHSSTNELLYHIQRGELVFFHSANDLSLREYIENKTANLHISSSLPSLFYHDIYCKENDYRKLSNVTTAGLLGAYLFGSNMHIYMETSDAHEEFFLNQLINKTDQPDEIIKGFQKVSESQFTYIRTDETRIPKDKYARYEETVHQLFYFLRIFKTDLKGIEIDRKEDHEDYICTPVMVYEGYKIHGEFESNGVKKLIKLFTYFKKMANGSIVFIDELDANLHDVYLCALIEYLMEYGEGQLCFTTHNVGPMDVLRKNKKSIDFLSMDQVIYPWKSNGNYSPSSLYRNGMIEGSPFNVDSIDFLGILDSSEDKKWELN